MKTPKNLQATLNSAANISTTSISFLTELYLLLLHTALTELQNRGFFLLPATSNIV